LGVVAASGEGALVRGVDDLQAAGFVEATMECRVASLDKFPRKGAFDKNRLTVAVGDASAIMTKSVNGKPKRLLGNGGLFGGFLVKART
jgi:hypothetical protein